MKHILTFLVLVPLLIGAASSSDWYPEKLLPLPNIQSNVGGSHNIEGRIAIQTIAAAESSDDDQLLNATGGALNNTTNLIINSTGTGSAYFLAQPDVPRNIIGTVNASTYLDLKITGTDIANATITENLTWAAATGVKASTKAFRTVTRIDATLAANQTAKTVKIGVGDLLGLNSKLSRNSVIAEYVNGARETIAGTVTTSSTMLGLNTIDTYTAPGGYVTVVYYVV